jgi:AAA domain
MALKFHKSNTVPLSPGDHHLSDEVSSDAIDFTDPSASVSLLKAEGPHVGNEHSSASPVSLIEPGPAVALDSLTTRKLSSVTVCEVKWLWEPYLPVGELAILSGDPGIGKTWIATGISADLTCGRTPFTHEPRPPAAVLYLTVENSPQELRRRFTLQGANLDLVHIANNAVLLSDIPVLNAILEKTKAKLIAVDPIQSFLGPVDTYRAGKIRPVLDALTGLAQKHGCCMLFMRHLNKASAGRAIHRGTGGIDLSAAARSELLAGHQADDKNQLALVHLKSNLAPYGTSLGYAIGEKGFNWTGQSIFTSDDLLAPQSHGARGEAMTKAVDFLLTTLSSGPCKAKQVYAEAKELHIKEITLDRAKRKLKILSEKDGQSGPWLWSLHEGNQIPPTQKS